MSDEPSNMQWLLNILEGGVAFLVASGAAVAGFIATQVFMQARETSALKQRMDDLQGTIERIHAEELAWRAEVTRRLDAIERQG